MSSLSKPSILVYNVTSGTTLFQTNTNTQRPMASLVKLMTAMVALDQISDLAITLPLSECTHLEEMGIEPVYVDPLTGTQHKKIRNTIIR